MESFSRGDGEMGKEKEMAMVGVEKEMEMERGWPVMVMVIMPLPASVSVEALPNVFLALLRVVMVPISDWIDYYHEHEKGIAVMQICVWGWRTYAMVPLYAWV